MSRVPLAGVAIDIGIKTGDREKIALGLSRLLADTYSLYLKTHNFHWNVEGPMFNTLHLMFMEQYTELWTALDAVAERIRSLGFPGARHRQEFSSSRRSRKPKACPKRWTWCACWWRVTKPWREPRARFSGGGKAGDESTCGPADAALAGSREDRVDAAQPAEVTSKPGQLSARRLGSAGVQQLLERVRGLLVQLQEAQRNPEAFHADTGATDHPAARLQAQRHSVDESVHTNQPGFPLAHAATEHQADPGAGNLNRLAFERRDMVQAQTAGPAHDLDPHAWIGRWPDPN